MHRLLLTALPGLLLLTAAPRGLAEPQDSALAVKQSIDLLGWDLQTDSFDSGDPWKSNFGQYDSSIYSGDRGDVMTGRGLVSSFGTPVVNLYGRLMLGTGGTVSVGGLVTVGSHTWQAGHVGIEPGYLLENVSFTFPDTFLPYSSGLPPGGPQTVVTVGYDYTRASTNSPIYPNPPPWSGVTTNFLGYATNATCPQPLPPGLVTNMIVITNTLPPDPLPDGIVTNTVGMMSTDMPAPGTYVPPITKIGKAYYYMGIIGYSWRTYTWPNYSYTYSLYTTNSVYVTNHYDHVLWSGDYYFGGELHGSTIILGDASLVLPNGLSMSGNDQITVAQNARLRLFCGGSQCTVGGNGVINQGGYASSCIVECTHDVTNCNVNCNGEFIGVILAPSADVAMNGGGRYPNDFIGALMANSVQMNGTFRFHYDEALARLPTCRPRIVDQPQSQSFGRGMGVTFIVTAAGTWPLYYQWRFNGSPISDATNRYLNVTDVKVQNAGSYSVLVTNGCGSQTSVDAVLTVICVQPTNVTVFAGQDAQFTLAATPSAPLPCQWQFGGTNIPGATNATLLLGSVTKAQAGDYVVNVTNVTGWTASSAGTLVVRDPPAAVLGSPLCADGGPFQVTITGEGSVAYVVEVSTNLLDWEPLVTNTPPFVVLDSEATNSAQRFYRTLWRP